MQLPIRGAVSAERCHSSLRGVREPLVTTQSHNNDQYSSDTLLQRPLGSSGRVDERAKKWWKSQLIELWVTVGHWKQECPCLACVFWKAFATIYFLKKKTKKRLTDRDRAELKFQSDGSSNNEPAACAQVYGARELKVNGNWHVLTASRCWGRSSPGPGLSRHVHDSRQTQ